MKNPAFCIISSHANDHLARIRETFHAGDNNTYADLTRTWTTMAVRINHSRRVIKISAIAADREGSGATVWSKIPHHPSPPLTLPSTSPDSSDSFSYPELTVALIS